MHRQTILPLVVFLGFILLGASCSDSDDYDSFESTEFTRAAVQPDWFKKTKTIPLNSWQEMQDLWLSEKRCCDGDFGVKKANREFYKSCYRAIQSKPADSNLVPYCLWLMDVALDSEQSYSLSLYLLDRYGDFRQPTNYCANCSPGDLIARVTHEVARHEFYQSQNAFEPAGRIEAMLAERETEISFWILGEIYVTLARMYKTLPDSSSKTFELAERIDRLESIWPNEERQQWRLTEVREAYSDLLGQ